jgi:diketogulonate reductase-like aldo/keto reductase
MDTSRHGGPPDPYLLIPIGLAVVLRTTLAVAWTLAHPAVHAGIVGARRPSHPQGTVGAAEVTLSQADLDRIAGIMRDAAPVHGRTPERM